MRLSAISAASASAVVLLGVCLSALALLPSDIVQLPYTKYGWGGVGGALLALYVGSLLIVYIALGIFKIIWTVIFRVFVSRVEIVKGNDQIKSRMKSIVLGSRAYLGITGSRMRDVVYLKLIEDHLSQNPDLAHTRVLFGHPAHAEGVQHIQRLRKLRATEEGKEGEPTIRIGIYSRDTSHDRSEPERNYCISEKAGIVILQSHTGLGKFDCALFVRDRSLLRGWQTYTEELYAACDIKISREKDLAQL